MTKKELVAAMSAKSDLSKAAAERALNAFTAAVTGALKKGGTVGITGFGTFRVSHRSARKGRNPRTGAVITIKASKNPTFKSGKALKSACN